jgi:Peptidase family M1 domain
MIQRQLNIYFVLIMSMTLSLFHVPAFPAANAKMALDVKHLPARVQESLAQELPSPPFSVPPALRESSAKEKYNIDVVMDYARHFATVEETISYPNRTNQQLDSLTLAVAPNLSPNCFDLIRVAVDSIPVTEYNLNKQHLDVSLPYTLEPDSTVQLTLRYSLSLPYLNQFDSINSPLLGYTDMQLNLVNWYPFIVPFLDGEWTLHDSWWYGDYLLYPTADYVVDLLFVGAENAPVVAASGSSERIVDLTRYTLGSGRAFALSISPYFEVSSMKAGGTTVSSYYLPGSRKSAEAAMKTSAQAIGYFSAQFGEYPHSTYSIVQASLNDSREFSGLSFISRNFYQQYDGTSANYLAYVSVHAAAHQWWSDQVGNDTAMEPWLDESLATYSEKLFFESVHPDLLDYWQTNRVDFFRPQGKINAAIYDSENQDIYKQAVYFNGVYFFNDLRERMGEEDFHAFLLDYFQQGKGKIVTRDDFFKILDEHTDLDYSDIVSRYFK